MKYICPDGEKCKYLGCYHMKPHEYKKMCSVSTRVCPKYIPYQERSCATCEFLDTRYKVDENSPMGCMKAYFNPVLECVKCDYNGWEPKKKTVKWRRYDITKRVINDMRKETPMKRYRILKQFDLMDCIYDAFKRNELCEDFIDFIKNWLILLDIYHNEKCIVGKANSSGIVGSNSSFHEFLLKYPEYANQLIKGGFIEEINPSITWKEFKEKVENNGVSDDNLIYIDQSRKIIFDFEEDLK